MRRRNLLLLAILGADLLVFPFLIMNAAAPARTEVCYSIPDICSVQFEPPVATPIGVPAALFVLCSELMLFLLLGFTDLPGGPVSFKVAAGAGLGGTSVVILGSSRALVSLDPSLTPYMVYSTLTSFLVPDPAKYSDATHLYYGLAVYDVEAVLLLALGLCGTFLVYEEKSKADALARVVRVGALLGSFLAVDVAIFDFPEFFIHATAIQEQLRLMTWFTNADLLAVGVGVVAATFLVPRLRSPSGDPTTASS